jgi:hypothetical protein
MLCPAWSMVILAAPRAPSWRRPAAPACCRRAHCPPIYRSTRFASRALPAAAGVAADRSECGPIAVAAAHPTRPPPPARRSEHRAARAAFRLMAAWRPPRLLRSTVAAFLAAAKCQDHNRVIRPRDRKRGVHNRPGRNQADCNLPDHTLLDRNFPEDIHRNHKVPDLERCDWHRGSRRCAHRRRPA